MTTATTKKTKKDIDGVPEKTAHEKLMEFPEVSVAVVPCELDPITFLRAAAVNVELTNLASSATSEAEVMTGLADYVDKLCSLGVFDREKFLDMFRGRAGHMQDFLLAYMAAMGELSASSN